MSRIGRLPVAIPTGVTVNIDGETVRIKGPKGELSRTFSPLVDISLSDGQLIVQRDSDEATKRALHGTTRALLANMVTGVSTGFVRVLEVEGVGYRPELNGNNLILHVGYSHPVVVEPPEGVTFEVETRSRQVRILGFDKEQIGQLAANIRKIRPPEPYKGKGIRYAGEKVRRKAGKSGKAKK